MKTQWRRAVTHISDRMGLRGLTFGACWKTNEEAEEILTRYRPNLGRVLSLSELATLEVSPMECYENGDPVRVYVGD